MNSVRLYLAEGWLWLSLGGLLAGEVGWREGEGTTSTAEGAVQSGGPPTHGTPWDRRGSSHVRSGLCASSHYRVAAQY